MSKIKNKLLQLTYSELKMVIVNNSLLRLLGQLNNFILKLCTPYLNNLYFGAFPFYFVLCPWLENPYRTT